MTSVPASFLPVINLPNHYEVLDLTTGEYTPSKSLYSIGKYNEQRSSMYTQALFRKELEPRNIHMGIDIGAPINTEVFTFDDAQIITQAFRSTPGDYGYCMILEYIWQQDYPLRANRHAVNKGESYWALYGHLSALSLSLHQPGNHVKKGTCIGLVGADHENGGWTPHLHFQLSIIKPQTCDLPGVVSQSEYQNALNYYPDPRQILGPLYD